MKQLELWDAVERRKFKIEEAGKPFKLPVVVVPMCKNSARTSNDKRPRGKLCAIRGARPWRWRKQRAPPQAGPSDPGLHPHPFARHHTRGRLRPLWHEPEQEGVEEEDEERDE